VLIAVLAAAVAYKGRPARLLFFFLSRVLSRVTGPFYGSSSVDRAAGELWGRPQAPRTHLVMRHLPWVP